MFLTVSQLGVSYPGRDKPVVQSVSFGLKAGDIGVLIGPSGCGKTTLLRAVAGLEPITGGEIHINGQLVSSAHSALPPESAASPMSATTFWSAPVRSRASAKPSATESESDACPE